VLTIDKLPDEVKDALHSRGHSNEKIAAMSPEEVFTEYCNWHGLILWGAKLMGLVHSIDAAEYKATDNKENASD